MSREEAIAMPRSKFTAHEGFEPAVNEHRAVVATRCFRTFIDSPVWKVVTELVANEILLLDHHGQLVEYHSPASCVTHHESVPGLQL
jgi:hypothetical protein